MLWAAATAWWTLSGLFSAANYHQMAAGDGDPVSWRHALGTAMSSSYLWIPFTIAIFRLSSRFPLEGVRWRRSLLVLAGGWLGLVLARAGLVMILNRWVGWYTSLPPFGSVLVTSLSNNTFLYWMLVGVAHALHYAQRTREREMEASRLTAQLAQARLDALKAQLHPHFLFNTLHSVAELVHVDPDAADRMIVRLSELLRRTLSRPTDEDVSLREELSLAALYLDIERMRFGDRLQVDWEVTAESMGARIPQLLLQPLIENALRHGLAGRAAPGHLVVAACIRGPRLALEVRDDGAGPDPSSSRSPGGGLGLSNIRARLRQRYGADHRFSLAQGPAGGTVATIELPLAESGPA
jgi:two-component system, LytTR family, sensor kinase